MGILKMSSIAHRLSRRPSFPARCATTVRAELLLLQLPLKVREALEELALLAPSAAALLLLLLLTTATTAHRKTGGLRAVQQDKKSEQYNSQGEQQQLVAADHFWVWILSYLIMAKEPFRARIMHKRTCSNISNSIKYPIFT